MSKKKVSTCPLTLPSRLYFEIILGFLQVGVGLSTSSCSSTLLSHVLRMTTIVFSQGKKSLDCPSVWTFNQWENHCRGEQRVLQSGWPWISIIIFLRRKIT